MSFSPAAILAASLFVAALSACSPSAVADPFDDTGELIALSGGDAGAASACHTCHGLEGEGDGALAPRIAGLDPGYIVRQFSQLVGPERFNKVSSREADPVPEPSVRPDDDGHAGLYGEGGDLAQEMIPVSDG